MSTFVGRRLPAPAVPVRRQALKLSVSLMVAWWLLRTLVRVLVVIARSPVAMAVIIFSTVAVLAVRTVGFGWAVAGSAWLSALLLGVVLWRPALGLRWRLVLRSRWRRFSIYRYKWPATMDMVDLNKTRRDGTAFAPVLGLVNSTLTADVVRARMLAGQTVEDWGRVSDGLCQTFGAVACRVRSIPNRPHHVDLTFLISDPLVEPLEPLEITNGGGDLAALPVGVCEDGTVYRLPLLGNHVLLVGVTGAGKSSVEWALIHQLAPFIADRTVRLWGVDPKRMELAYGADLFESLASDSEDIADLLDHAVQVMRARQARLGGFTRQHVPTADDPLVVVLIDELAALAYITDRDLKRRIEYALGLLLSQGRAVGVTVVGAVQDPRKETVPQRDLYTVRVCMRVTEAAQVVLVLGPGARDRGARADQIPESLPGVAFVQVDGVAEPVRVRFAHVTDADIRALAALTRPLRLVGVSGDPAAVAGPAEATEAA